MKPYTYILKHKPTDTYYYGIRYQNVKKKIPISEDLWTKYFTSSPKVKELIKEYGVDSFDFEVRKVFETPEQATAWETKVLTRCKVLHDDKWINSNIAGHIMPTAESNKKISDFHKGKPKTAEQKRKMSEAHKGKPKNPAMYNDEYRANMSKIKSGEGNAMFGQHHSDEAKRAIGEKNKAAWAAKDPNDHHMKKVKWTEERRAEMSAKSKGKKRPQYAIDAAAAKLKGRVREKKHCPHCDRMISLGWYDRHGDNCKMKNE
jgi:hypothetical protein